MRQHIERFEKVIILTDAIAITASFLAAYWVRSHIIQFGNLYPLEKYGWLVAVTILLWYFVVAQTKATCLDERNLRRIPIIAILKSTLICGFMLFTALFLFKWQWVSRSLTLIFVLFIPLFIVFERKILSNIFIASLEKNIQYQQRLLLVGKDLKHISDNIHQIPHGNGFQMAGYLSQEDEVESECMQGCKRLGTISDLSSVLMENVIDCVLVVPDLHRWRNISWMVNECAELGIPCHISIGKSIPRNLHLITETFLGMPMLTTSNIPISPWGFIVKSAFDRVVAFCFLILCSPIFAFITMGIKFTSEGSVLFSQVRSGINGRKFKFLKFRSMVDNAEDLLDSVREMDETTGPIFKARNDPRITKFGKFLRKTSLDELPQLINILRGDMSLVGPRPPISSEVEKYKPWERRRLSMKPGITCLWQVNGRSTHPFEKWMELDLEYIDNWSLLLDLKILLQTIPAVMSCKGAF